LEGVRNWATETRGLDLQGRAANHRGARGLPSSAAVPVPVLQREGASGAASAEPRELGGDRPQPVRPHVAIHGVCMLEQEQGSRPRAGARTGHVASVGAFVTGENEHFRGCDWRGCPQLRGRGGEAQARAKRTRWREMPKRSAIADCENPAERSSRTRRGWLMVAQSITATTNSRGNSSQNKRERVTVKGRRGGAIGGGPRLIGF